MATDAPQNLDELTCRNGVHAEVCRSNYIVYSSEASSFLADRIAESIGVPRGKIERKLFVGGEKYYRIDMDERYQLVGKDVIYVCSTTLDDELLELVRVGCAFAAYGSRRRIFIIPFLGYSCIPNSKLGNIFLFMDLHVQSLLQYLEGPSVRMELYAEHALLDAIRAELDLSQPFMFASADLGRPLWHPSVLACPKFKIVDVAPLFGDTLRSLMHDCENVNGGSGNEDGGSGDDRWRR
eukprot:jgi/Mesen1/6488/ME000331S05605